MAETEGPVTAPLLFLLGLVLFAAGTLAFAADLVTGHGVVRSLLANALGAFLLVGWAARDTLTDPDSAVDSPGGAAGTAILLYGLYLLLAGVIVAVTSVRHGRLPVGLGLAGAAVALIAVGFLVFPRGAVADDGDDGDGEPETPAADDAGDTRA
jgi:hypothetical protein